MSVIRSSTHVRLVSEEGGVVAKRLVRVLLEFLELSYTKQRKPVVRPAGTFDHEYRRWLAAYTSR